MAIIQTCDDKRHSQPTKAQYIIATTDNVGYVLSIDYCREHFLEMLDTYTKGGMQEDTVYRLLKIAT